MQLSITCVIRLRTTNLFRCNRKHVLWLDFQTSQTSLALMWICLSVHLAHVYRGIYIYVWVDIHVDYTGTCIYTYTLMLSFEQLQFSLNKLFEARVSSRFKFSSHLCTEAQPLKSSLQLSCCTASFSIPQHVLPCKCTTFWLCGRNAWKKWETSPFTQGNGAMTSAERILPHWIKEERNLQQCMLWLLDCHWELFEAVALQDKIRRNSTRWWSFIFL